MSTNDRHLSTEDIVAIPETDDVQVRQAQTEPEVAREPERGPEGLATAPLLEEEELQSFRARWQEIQGRFVDQPKGSVEEADGLVAELMKRLAESFARERSTLESQWERGDDVSTEDLRVALQRYRSFFERLLAA